MDKDVAMYDENVPESEDNNSSDSFNKNTNIDEDIDLEIKKFPNSIGVFGQSGPAFKISKYQFSKAEKDFLNTLTQRPVDESIEEYGHFKSHLINELIEMRKDNETDLIDNEIGPFDKNPLEKQSELIPSLTKQIKEIDFLKKQTLAIPKNSNPFIIETDKHFSIREIGSMSASMTNHSKVFLEAFAKLIEINPNAQDEINKYLKFAFINGVEIRFNVQTGPVGEFGKNGLDLTFLLEYILNIYTLFNNKFPCEENDITIEYITRALIQQRLRTENRKSRNVEGVDEA